MRWSSHHTHWLARSFAKAFQGQKWIELKVDTHTFAQFINDIITKNFQAEKDLDKEVRQMMDDLEKEHSSFDRQKMYPLLKKKLAEKKGIVL